MKAPVIHNEELRFRLYQYDYAEWLEDIQSAKVEVKSASHGSESTGTEFSGSNSYEEALGFAKNGWGEGVKKMAQMQDHDVVGLGYGLIPEYKMAGDMVDVGRYLSGEPENMVEWGVEEKRGNIIDLYYQGSASFSIQKKQMMEAGLMVLGLIDKLEAMGKQINLHLVFCNTYSNQGIVSTDILLKKAGQYVPMNVIAFAIAHPSCLRRISFRDRECHGYNDSHYGTSKNPEMIHLNAPPNSYIIPGIDVLIHQKDKKKFIQELITKITTEYETAI